MLGELAVLDADDVKRQSRPRGGPLPEKRPWAMDEIGLGHDQLVFVAQRLPAPIALGVKQAGQSYIICWSATSASSCELSRGCPFSRPGRSRRPRTAPRR